MNNGAALLWRWGRMFFCIFWGLFRALYPVSLKIKWQRRASCKADNYKSQCEMQSSAFFGKRKSFMWAWKCLWLRGKSEATKAWVVLKQIHAHIYTSWRIWDENFGRGRVGSLWEFISESFMVVVVEISLPAENQPFGVDFLMWCVSLWPSERQFDSWQRRDAEDTLPPCIFPATWTIRWTKQMPRKSVQGYGACHVSHQPQEKIQIDVPLNTLWLRGCCLLTYKASWISDGALWQARKPK